jgi:fermentation-respiration switch protein FrsA (DUF1100 family)
MAKFVFGLFGLGMLSYAAICLTLWFRQTRLIFYPQPAPLSTPADVGLAYEDVWIPVEQGHIHGWWIPSRAPNPYTALVLHGNASNVEDTLYQSQSLLAAGMAALIIDYRGYGHSSGPFPSEASVYEDAAAAWDYLTQTRQIPSETIVIFGHSIGGAIAIDLATQRPQAAGLIVKATFSSMADMMDHVGYSRFFPKWLLHQQFDSYSKIQDIPIPVFLIHGVDDTTVPFTMSEQLYSAIPGPKELWLIPQAGHNDIIDTAGEAYPHKLRQWLLSLPQPQLSAYSGPKP